MVVLGGGVHPEGIVFASRGVRSSDAGAELDGATFRLLKAGSFIVKVNAPEVRTGFKDARNTRVDVGNSRRKCVVMT